MVDSIETIEAQDDERFVADGFDALTWPKGREEFFGDYWERRPYCVLRDRPGFFDDLLRLEDVDEYLGTRAFHKPDIRIVKQGKDLKFEHFAKDGVADRARVLQEFKGGAMLLLSQLNRHHAPLAEFVSRCEAQTHVPMRSNVYLSPPDSQGFNLHWDTHDVLVVQVSGSKRWHIHDNPLELPHEDQRDEVGKWLDKSRKIGEVVLRPGSMLFLPRGFIHGAQSEDNHSLHITFGLRTLTVADVILGEFRRRSLQDLEMRRVALLDDFAEPGRLDQAMAALRRVIEAMDLEGAVDDVHKSFIASRQPPARGSLLDIAIPATPVAHDDRLRLRRDALFKVFGKGDAISLAVDGVVVKLPGGVAQALDHVVAEVEFTPDTLPGLEHESKLILARTLLGCRLVEYA